MQSDQGNKGYLISIVIIVILGFLFVRWFDATFFATPSGWDNPDQIFEFACKHDDIALAMGTADGTAYVRDTIFVMKNNDSNNYVFNVNFSGTTKPAYIIKRINYFYENDETYQYDAIVINGQQDAGKSEILNAQDTDKNFNLAEGKGYTYQDINEVNHTN